MDRPRRSTRNSLYASSTSTTSTPTTSGGTSTSNSAGAASAGNNNPYKKPTYLANRPPPPDLLPISASTTPTSGRGRGRGRPSSARNGSLNSSAHGTPTSAFGGRGGRPNSRPECVATRVESRRSTGGSGSSASNNVNKKKKRGAYNSQDYHYGSDFSDQNDSDGEGALDGTMASGSETPSELGRDDADSDSDFSIGSSKHHISRPPSPPVPLWMDAETTIEELELPKSSDDLLLERDFVMKAVAVYEPLRRFHQLVRLSPFRFEDFCAALASEETSFLLTEIHVQLLKTILREEEANGTLFGPTELKDSIATVLHFIDSLTWPECLRSYAESDPKWVEIHGLISSVEYPFGGGAQLRIKVLSWMVDQFLATGLVRDSLQQERIRHDDYCRACNKFGEVLMCETCPAVYHLYCISPPYKSDEVPPDDWQCPVCVKSSVSGIGDCASDLEKAGLLIRHEKLGIDRHGRKYWFLIRRVLVESEDGSSVWYYSTPIQVEELLYRLDEEGYESELVENIRAAKDEIIRQMQVTESITDEANGFRKKTYIDAENAFLKKVHEDREKAHIKQIEDAAKEVERAAEAQRLEEEKKVVDEEDVKAKEEAEKKRIREERLLRRNQNKFTDYNPADWVDGEGSEHSPSSSNDGGETKVNHCDEREKSQEIKQESSNEKEVKSEDKDVIMTESQIQQADTQVIGSPEIAPAKTKEETVPEIKNEVDNEMEVDAATNAKETSVTASTAPKKDNNYDDLFTKVEKGGVMAEGVETPPSLPNANRRKSKALLLDWDTEERMTRLKATGLYKLGQEGNYRTYVNIYNTDNLALSKFQHGEESNKKRQMSHKFSLTPASEVKWASFSNSVGMRSNLISCLRATLVHLETSVPGTLMHINWTTMKKAWLAAVSQSAGPADFSKAMISLAACLRPSVFNPIWTEGVGHHKLIRTSALEREERKKAEKRDKKDRDDEEDRLRLLPQFVKYSIPAKHQVYKQKGEEYRIHGRWGWIWMSALRRCKPTDCRKLGLLAGPHKHVIQVKNDTGTVKTILIDPTVFNKLMAKRSLSQKGSSAITKPSLSSVEKPPTTKVEKSEEKSETTSSTPEEHVEKMEVDEVASPGDESEKVKSEDELVASKEGEEATPAGEASKIDHSIESSMEIDTRSEDIKVGAPDSKSSSSSRKTEEESTSLIPKSEPGAEESTRDKSTSGDTTSATDEDKQDIVKTEVKEESESVTVQPEKPASSSDVALPAAGGMGVGRKFRTDLVNVSLGIVSANRILYPKIAHKSTILENLLTRRVALQQREEVELLETFGKEKLDSVQAVLDNGGKIEVVGGEADKEINNEAEEVLEDTFPLAGIYRYKCYSYMCQAAAEAFKTQNKTQVREHEYTCYSPMCRLKFFVQDSSRRKEERVKALEAAKMAQLVEDVVSKRMFTQTESSAKILLKALPNEGRNRSKKSGAVVKYPLTSTFKSGSSNEPSIFVLPPHELKKLARTAGRCFTPWGFAPAPKTGTWAWPYPCGRPIFKTGWQFKAVHANTLAAAALQLRILWASVKWDDILMKAPNHDGKSQITTDMEIITSEILNHRVVGRFLERVQYLRKKTVEPIDAPKTIREVTPSRSGLRKRKLAESLAGCDPVVTEEWVDEDRLELWEIKLYHDKLEHPGRSYPESNSKPGTPLGSTRTKSGVTLRQPEKYDPSYEPEGRPVSAAKSAEIMETELKMQRAVHLSKRDNHPKNNNNAAKTAATLTASQQLQQQQAAAGLPANPRSYGGAGPGSGKKVSVVSTKTIPTSTGGTPGGEVSSPATTAASILNRKSNAVAIPKVQPGNSPFNQTQQKITVFRTPDGKLQVQGLLPGQSVYQTPDGKLGLHGAPIRPLNAKPLAPSAQASTNSITPQTTGQTILIQSSEAGQLHQQSPVPTAASSTPLINISSPAMRTVLASSSGVSVSGVGGNTIKLLSTPISTSSPQQIHTYSKNVRKVNPKFPNTPTAIAIAPATSSSPSTPGQLTGSLNAQGQIVLTRGGQVIQGINSQGQIVIAASPGQSPVQGQSQGTIIVSSGSGGNLINLNKNPATTVPSGSPQVGVVQTSSGNTTTLQIGQSPGSGVAIATHQPGGKVVIQDGTKTIVVSGGGNLTQAQLQQILAMNLKKTGTPGGKQHIQIQQVAKPSGQGQGQQQIAIQPSPTQGQMQIIQQVGTSSSTGQPQQVQIISGGQNIQQITGGQGQIILQSVPAGLVGAGPHQIANIGGQNVIVKKIVRASSPAKSGGSPSSGGVPVTISAPPGTPMPSAAQIQALLSSHKNLIRVDPKTGVMNISTATLAQLQQQQLQQQQQSPVQSQGATTVTKTPGLPISIVSPSKTNKLVSTLYAQGPLTPTSSLAATANVKTIPSVATPLVSPSSSSSQRPLAPATSPQKLAQTPTLIVSKGGTGITEVQQSVSPIPSPAVVASPAPPRTGAVASPAQQHGQGPPKIAAQFIETTNGPRVLISGFSGDLTPSQLANLNAQIFKQLQEHPQLREKFRACGENFNEMKIILQPNPPTVPSTPQSPAGAVVGSHGQLTPVAAVPSLTKTAPLSPVKGTPTKFLTTSPPKVTKVLASPITHSATTTLTLGAKSPPNSANIDAAIDAVASDINSPVIPPQGKSTSPKKFIQAGVMPSLAPTSPCPPKEDMLKNIMAKTEAPIKTPSPKKKSPKKSLATLMPLEAVPLPSDAQDVIISTDHHDGDVANEVEISENAAKGEVPRFVLSQDLVGQAGVKSMPDSASSMTFFSGHAHGGMTNNQTPPPPVELSNTTQKSGSSRRKSPVKAKQMQNSDPSPIAPPPKKRIAMSPIASQKQMLILNKHKELLRKDMSKKRSHLEAGIMMDVRKEISQDHPEENELGGDLIISEMEETSTGKAGGRKRKSSDGKGHGASKRQKRNSSGGGRGSNSNRKPGKKLACVCRTPYDNNKFYVVCDSCAKWYHGDCVGVPPPPEGEEVQEFVCAACKPSVDAGTGDDMCICRQPYVETQFCLACDKCDEWFHGRCIGILPTEGDAIPNYFCPGCEPNLKINAANAKTLTGVHYVELGKTLRQIQNFRSAAPFINPVNAGDAPNYYKVIKEPMDLKQIALRVDQKMYTTLKDFACDLAKLIDNCRFFNPPESHIFKSGKLLETFCSQKMKPLREFVEKH